MYERLDAPLGRSEPVRKISPTHRDSIAEPTNHQDLVGYKNKYCLSAAGTGIKLQ
jgi:hypothetical protein